jgi:predicted transcriptional regulator of viral defense system
MAKYFGPKEMAVISRLSYEKVTIITKKQFDKLFGQSILTRQIIYQLKKKGILKPIIKGIYYYSPLEAGPAGSRVNEFLIPPALFPKGNYYVGYSTMYNYYGLTEQIFQTFYILNTSLQRKREIFGISFKLLKVPANRMYGLEKVKIRESQIIVSDRERTLVDLVYFPDPVGGLKKALEIFKEASLLNKTDLKKLIKYASIFPSVSTRKRIGFILEKAEVSKLMLAPLLKSIKNRNTLVTLYGSESRKGEINNTWKVIIDDSRQ